MCRFCIEHGDGQKWYLEASTYASDLGSDLRRRGYVVDFLRNFDRNRAHALTYMDVLGAAPRPIERAGKREFARRMQKNHFGQPVPIEDCERIFAMATSIVNVPCPCRTFAGGPEQGYCLVVTTRPVNDVLAEGFADYKHGPDVSAFQSLTKEEAVSLLRRCEDEGLMHSVWTFVTPWIGAICNCDLESGCMAMRLTVEHGAKIMWKGEYVADVDPELCNGCGTCAERCPFAAIDVRRSERATVRAEDCWGCGVCRSGCLTSGIRLLDRAAVPAAAGVW